MNLDGVDSLDFLYVYILEYENDNVQSDREKKIEM